MEQTYWLGRKRISLANARRAANAQARLVHLDLAGRYSVKAADAAPSPTDPAYYERLETAEGFERERHLDHANRYARLRLDAPASGRR